jgi:2,4-didehydro-3-deoxy-L-rhamnonate hydrolase
MMRFATVQHEGTERVAVVGETGISLLPPIAGGLVGLIEGGPTALAAARQALAAGQCKTLAPDAVHFLPPITRFRRDILCTGWNYWDHFEESVGKRDGQDVPRPGAPTFFTKAPDAVIGPYDHIAYDARVSAKWDYEAEVVVVIGKEGRSIPAARAMEHVFGYCLANDVSQRDLQRRHGGQWFKGKSLDGTMPLGPWIVLAEDIDITEVRLQCELNGQLMQDALVKQMAFAIPELIAELSLGMTLRPGDVLLTGTPSGVGNAREPQLFLKAGDQVVVRGTGLGELRNTLRETDLYGASGVTLA